MHDPGGVPAVHSSMMCHAAQIVKCEEGCVCRACRCTVAVALSSRYFPGKPVKFKKKKKNGGRDDSRRPASARSHTRTQILRWLGAATWWREERRAFCSLCCCLPAFAIGEVTGRHPARNGTRQPSTNRPSLAAGCNHATTNEREGKGRRGGWNTRSRRRTRLPLALASASSYWPAALFEDDPIALGSRTSSALLAKQ